MTHDLIDDFLQRNQLGRDYLAQAAQWFDPLLERLHSATTRTQPLLLGISGCQGSGKSTLAEYLCAALQQRHGLRTVVCSLDDFYLTRAERQQLAQTVHPLLATRGVPGTHDVAMATRKLRQLREREGEVALPLFAKQNDDRAENCQRVTLPVDLVVFEGWCLGAMHQTDAQLAEPVNGLERQHDPQGLWRSYVNRQLAGGYRELFAQIDHWLMLQAPSFDCVRRWRMEQETKLAQRLGTRIDDEDDNDNDNDNEDDNSTGARNGDHQHLMSAAELDYFIQHYQRITEHLLDTLPAQVDDLYVLDGQRRIVEHRRPRSQAG